MACTGVHGANRLASNSLLEGLVFGARAASAMRETGAVPVRGAEGEREFAAAHAGNEADLLKQLQQQMWRDAGLLRDAAGLSAMQQALVRLRVAPVAERSSLELANLHAVAELIVLSALAREESRGAHYRNDFPKRDDAHFAKHSVVRGGEVSLEAAPQAALVR